MFPALTIVAGLITASPLIVARQPNAKQIFARLQPVQGFLGLGILALGIVWLLRWLPNLGASLTSVSGMIVLAMIVANILLGFLMGAGLLSGLLARNEKAAAGSERLLTKLRTVQVPLGVGATLLGVASFVL